MIYMGIPSDDDLDVLLNEAEITTNISDESNIEVNFEDFENLDTEVEIEQLDVTFNEAIVISGNRLPDYHGEYNVVPKVTSQVLLTKNKSMLDNVTVFQIPYHSVSNPAGGNTVTIGLE